MCECGCTANDERYLFPAPGDKVYMLTLSKGCVECDAPSGVIIERIGKSDIHYRQRKDYTDGDLKFEKWHDTEGVAIITGLLRHEFVAALAPQLIGQSIAELCEDGEMDEVGAELLLEDLYKYAVVKPHFPAEAIA